MIPICPHQKGKTTLVQRVARLEKLVDILFLPTSPLQQGRMTLPQRISRLENLVEVLITERNATTPASSRIFSDSQPIGHIRHENWSRLGSNPTGYEFGSLTYWGSSGWMPQYHPSGTQLVNTNENSPPTG